jgi:hypothetical protein
MANNADFAFHAGHGWEDGVLFGTANTSYNLYRSNMQFGGNNGKAKWVALSACHVLNQSTQANWESVFDGLHILMGFDTEGKLGQYQGSQFADRMTGSDMYPVMKIRDAWIKTLQTTIDDATIRGAYMWADPSGDDYLPEFGTFREPIKSEDDKYTLYWESFECKNT